MPYHTVSHQHLKKYYFDASLHAQQRFLFFTFLIYDILGLTDVCTEQHTCKELSYGRVACLIAVPKNQLKALITNVHECKRCPC